MAAGDRTAFDALLHWTTQTLARPDIALHSWRYIPGQGVTDPNNATDGDILIAWALLGAAHKWNDAAYLHRSDAIRGALAERLIAKRYGLSLLQPGLSGFDNPDRLTLNLSYYIWPALDAFAQIDPQAWTPMVKDGLDLLGAARFGPLQLPADWIDVKGTHQVEPAAGRDPVFGFEGIRIPLYLLLSGRGANAAPIAHYWADRMKSGQPLPAWVNIVTGETATFPLSTGAQAIAARLNGVPLAGSGPTGDYYSTTLGMLSALKNR
jgi:endoglucanase